MSWLDGKSPAYRRAYKRYQQISGFIGRTVTAAAKRAGIDGIPGFAENFQGVEVPAAENDAGKATIVIGFSFGHPPRLAKTVELRVSVFLENKPRQKNGRDRVCESVDVIRGRFPLGEIPARWLTDAMRQAAGKAVELCTAEMFGGLLKKLRDERRRGK